MEVSGWENHPGLWSIFQRAMWLMIPEGISMATKLPSGISPSTQGLGGKIYVVGGEKADWASHAVGWVGNNVISGEINVLVD